MLQKLKLIVTFIGFIAAHNFWYFKFYAETDDCVNDVIKIEDVILLITFWEATPPA